jgi:hypothetical protein
MLIHPFVPSARATSPCNPAKSAQTVPLPNGSKLPTASSSAESSEEIFPLETRFFTKLGPQIRLPSVPNFGVNTFPWILYLWNSPEVKCYNGISVHLRILSYPSVYLGGSYAQARCATSGEVKKYQQ